MSRETSFLPLWRGHSRLGPCSLTRDLRPNIQSLETIFLPTAASPVPVYPSEAPGIDTGTGNASLGERQKEVSPGPLASGGEGAFFSARDHPPPPDPFPTPLAQVGGEGER